MRYIQYYDEFIITEGVKEKLPLLLKAFPELNEHNILEIAKFDPTYPKCAYLTWILRMVTKKNHNERLRFPEDGPRVHEVLQNFDQIKNDNNFKSNKDVNSYKTIQELKKEVDEFLGNDTNPFKRKNIWLDRLPAGADLLYRDGKYHVIKINTADAASTVLANSEWCVRHKDTATEYLNQSDTKDLSFILICKDNNNYVLLHFSTGQCKYPDDSSVNTQVTETEIIPLLIKSKILTENAIVIREVILDVNIIKNNVDLSSATVVTNRFLDDLIYYVVSVNSKKNIQVRSIIETIIDEIDYENDSILCNIIERLIFHKDQLLKKANIDINILIDRIYSKYEDVNKQNEDSKNHIIALILSDPNLDRCINKLNPILDKLAYIHPELASNLLIKFSNYDKTKFNIFNKLNYIVYSYDSASMSDFIVYLFDDRDGIDKIEGYLQFLLKFANKFSLNAWIKLLNDLYFKFKIKDELYKKIINLFCYYKVKNNLKDLNNLVQRHINVYSIVFKILKHDEVKLRKCFPEICDLFHSTNDSSGTYIEKFLLNNVPISLIKKLHGNDFIFNNINKNNIIHIIEKSNELKECIEALKPVLLETPSRFIKYNLDLLLITILIKSKEFSNVKDNGFDLVSSTHSIFEIVKWLGPNLQDYIKNKISIYDKILYLINLNMPFKNVYIVLYCISNNIRETVNDTNFRNVYGPVFSLFKKLNRNLNYSSNNLMFFKYNNDKKIDPTYAIIDPTFYKFLFKNGWTPALQSHEVILFIVQLLQFVYNSAPSHVLPIYNLFKHLLPNNVSVDNTVFHSYFKLIFNTLLLSIDNLFTVESIFKSDFSDKFETTGLIDILKSCANRIPYDSKKTIYISEKLKEANAFILSFNKYSINELFEFKTFDDSEFNRFELFIRDLSKYISIDQLIDAYSHKRMVYGHQNWIKIMTILNKIKTEN